MNTEKTPTVNAMNVRITKKENSLEIRATFYDRDNQVVHEDVSSFPLENLMEELNKWAYGIMSKEAA